MKKTKAISKRHTRRYANQDINPHLIICLDYKGNVVYYEDYPSLKEALDEMTRLWNSYFYDEDERNDWELEKLSNGFTAAGNRYLILSAINLWRAAYE